jgi:hypothetical protein
MVSGSHGGIVRRTERTGRSDDAKTKKAGTEIMAPKEGVKIFVENVTPRYVIAIQDLPKKQHDRGRIS